MGTHPRADGAPPAVDLPQVRYAALRSGAGPRHIDVFGGELIVAAALPMVMRRAWPLGALVVTVAATTAYLILGYPYGLIMLSLVVAVYTTAVYLSAGCAAAARVAALDGVFEAGPRPEGGFRLYARLPI